MGELNLAFLGTWVALHTDGLAATFARAGVGLGALTTNGKPLAMALSAVAVDAEQTLHVGLLLTTEVTLSDKLHALDGLNDLRKLIVGEFASADVGVDVGRGKDLAAQGKTDAIDVGQRVFDLLVVGDVDSEEAGHGARGEVMKSGSALALLVTRVFAHHTHHTLPTDDAAVFAKLFD